MDKALIWQPTAAQQNGGMRNLACNRRGELLIANGMGDDEIKHYKFFVRKIGAAQSGILLADNTTRRLDNICQVFYAGAINLIGMEINFHISNVSAQNCNGFFKNASAWATQTTDLYHSDTSATICYHIPRSHMWVDSSGPRASGTLTWGFRPGQSMYLPDGIIFWISPGDWPNTGTIPLDNTSNHSVGMTGVIYYKSVT